jgi:hypothetical protein
MISARPPEIRSTCANCSKTPHRVVGGEDGDRAREPDLLGHSGDRGQCRRRRGDEVVGAVVLSDREEFQADLVGEFGLVEEIVHSLLGADARAGLGGSGSASSLPRNGSNNSCSAAKGRRVSDSTPLVLNTLTPRSRTIGCSCQKRRLTYSGVATDDESTASLAGSVDELRQPA